MAKVRPEETNSKTVKTKVACGRLFITVFLLGLC